jgi:hypothetical protein
MYYAVRLTSQPVRRLWLEEYGSGLWLVSHVADHVTMGRGPGGIDVMINFAIDEAWQSQ